MNKIDNRNSTEWSLDSTLKDAAEGYGDLVAISVVHKISIRALRSRLKELQMEAGEIEEEKVKTKERRCEKVA